MKNPLYTGDHKRVGEVRSITFFSSYLFSILVDQVVKSEFNTAPAKGRDKAAVKE